MLVNLLRHYWMQLSRFLFILLVATSATIVLSHPGMDILRREGEVETPPPETTTVNDQPNEEDDEEEMITVERPGNTTPSPPTRIALLKASKASNASKESKSEGDEVTAKLLLNPAENTPPENVIFDKYGGAQTLKVELNFTLSGGGFVRVYSEMWKTHYTPPPTCICITRGPLSNMKKYGNIKFKFIKITTPRYVTDPTSGTTTVCPPCVCPNC